MTGRDRQEEHRASTPLELLFDLCFVVAVSSAAASLHHSIVAGHPGSGVVSYLGVFFAIWWAWVNFSWLGSAYDTDDVLYRLLTLVQIGGALVIAAGVPAAFDNDFTIVTIGYTIIRVGHVSQWLRVVHDDRAHRRLALTYVVGLVIVQALWIARLALPHTWGLAVFPVLVVLEILVPVVAEKAGTASWHPEHIAERYSLFTLIVLGEVVASASVSVRTAVDAGGLSGSLVMVAVGGLLIVFGLWWIYFKHRVDDGLTMSDESAFVWGYGHFFVFAAAASVGASVGAISDLSRSLGHGSEHVALTPRAGALALAGGISVYLLVLAGLQARMLGRPDILVRAAAASAALCLVALPGLDPGVTVLLMGAVMVVVVAVQIVVDRPRRELPPARDGLAADPVRESMDTRSSVGRSGTPTPGRDPHERT